MVVHNRADNLVHLAPVPQAVWEVGRPARQVAWGAAVPEEVKDTEANTRVEAVAVVAVAEVPLVAQHLLAHPGRAVSGSKHRPSRAALAVYLPDSSALQAQAPHNFLVLALNRLE